MVASRILTFLAAAALLGVAAVGRTDVDGAADAAAAASGAATAVRVERAAAGTVIRIDDGAALLGYTNAKVTMAAGGVLSVVNHDSMKHSVTSVAKRANGKPLFDAVVGAGGTVTIAGASGLAPGTYKFYCRFHPVMRGTLVVTGTGDGTGAHASRPRFRQPLVVPRVITSAHPRLVVRRQAVRVLPTGPKTVMWTYGGSYPAPTIRRPAGHDTKVTFTDELPKAGELTVHLHGDHHSSADDGQPDSHLIAPGESHTYDYPLTDRGRPTRSTLEFYHDHRMMKTGRNNWYGMQGMFVITSPLQRRLRLPSGRYDVPLMVSDRTFDAHNQLVNPYRKMRMVPDDGVTGQQVLVDGRFMPYLEVATHRYRLRLLNSSNFTSYDFELSDGQPFVQIGNGDGLFAHPVVRRDILLGPAQTADVVVDFRHELGRRIVLRSVPRVANPHHGTGTPETPLMQFRVDQRTTDTSRVPADLQRPLQFHAPADVGFDWVLGQTDDGMASQWTINGRTYDPARVDVAVPLGSTQTWRITNPTSMTHYVHLHEEQWHTVSRDGHRPPPWERGLENTWRLDPGETVTVAATFTDYTGVFMIHCHMLDHEDHGMMAQFAVLPPGRAQLPRGFHLAGGASAVGSGTMPSSMGAEPMGSAPMN